MVTSYLKMISHGAKKNILMLNATKTQGLIKARTDLTNGVGPLTIDGHTIPYLNLLRNLDLYVDHRLNWEPHVSREFNNIENYYYRYAEFPIPNYQSWKPYN
jgi:hypothetical protein